MTERIERMRQFFVVDKGQKAMWQKEENPYVLAEQFAAEQTPDVDRAARRLIYVLDKEEPVLFEDERIAFTRTVTTIPEIFYRSGDGGTSEGTLDSRKGRCV